MWDRNLALAIVQQAVIDYRKNKAQGKSVSQISKFFKSDWCDFLLIGTSLSGEGILRQLKKQYSGVTPC
jgi:hypothetical protein